MSEEKITPYDTGKIKIGIHYAPDTRPRLSSFDERLQEALLGEPDNAISRYLDRHPVLAPILVFTFIVFVMLIADAIEHF